jgi:hypothetical protein
MFDRLLSLPAFNAPDGSGGGTFLTSAPPAAPAAVQGNPDPAAAAPVSAAQAQLQETMDGPPEWCPEKYWDKDKKAPRIEDLAKGYKNLEHLLGREKVPLPVGDDDEEGWGRVYNALGRPEAPDKYEFKRPDMPEGLEYAEDREKAFRERAFQAGFNKKQAAVMYEFGVANELERFTQYQQSRKEARQNLEGALERNYGKRLPDVKQTAQAVMSQHMTPEFKALLDESGYGDHPAMVDFVYRVGKSGMGESRIVGTKEPTRQAQPQDFARAIAEYRGKHQEALWNSDHPNHRNAVKGLNELYDAKNAERD